MLIGVIIILALVSVLWAWWSLRHLQHDKKQVQHVKRELIQGRVVFHRDETH